jgi:hypothetical protein
MTAAYPLLRQSPLFEDVPDHLVNAFRAQGTARLAPDERLLTAVTENATLFLGLSGAVAAQFAAGTRPHLRVGPGECVGELSVIDQSYGA